MEITMNVFNAIMEVLNTALNYILLFARKPF